MRRCGIALPALLTGYLWLKGWHPALPGLSCPLRALTGLPCPTCFLTRSTAAALHGRFTESVDLHAFGPIAAVALLAWSAQALWTRRLMPKGLKDTHLALATLLLLLYWAGRMGLTYGVGIAVFPDT
ncbi:DUF2752 domain-containing protein [Synechococcus sp. Cruz-9H2]|nr:DUF2752 domain-containing protein [Synechococcus sp. Cruz-9H2]MCP9843454.1 DUF2752 domain-containing protein [Synechococcus sp. Edmonson 11F2]MCP9855164.1 DUF2752 domain-containing protein [Synechococcus sp. Cruz-9C9]MCP9862864.1 DUF2752 domain-containing protein [Synechococcus sp. Cruz-7E5]MCP9869860.1 DUF2752 domain-containing protein [Synechococcus sp. Cruz-7B9]